MNRAGRLVRLPLKLVPDSTPLRVLTGPLAGQLWISTEGTHGYWLGTYERDLQKLFVSTIRPGQVVWDIGANVGLFTLLAARLVGPAGRVIALEPLPRNLDLVQKHLALNGIGNVTVLAQAVADATGSSFFATGSSPSMGHLDAEQGLEVNVTTIYALVESGAAPPPDAMKMDIEGAESRALAGARRTLEVHRPVILLSTHGRVQHEACWSMLRELGYELSLRRDGAADGQYESVATPRPH
jgi:FkbM family methyltransferase